MAKTFVSALAVIGAALAVPAHADTLASWSTFTLNAQSGSNASAKSFSAQSGDLYIQLSLTPLAGTTISANDFAALWLDNAASGDHTAVPNVGLKADVQSTGDYMVRGNSSNNYIGAFTTDQAAAGTTVSLWAHLYKSSGSGTYNTFDLWTNPTATTWSAVLATTAEATSTLNSGLTTISSAGFRAATLSGNDAIQVSNAAIYNSIPGVPEPETYAMLLAGLGLMGTIARRTKNKS